jgi:hypothetical protein
MPDIASHNGIAVADIASINGQDVPSGGGGITANTIASSGVQSLSNASIFNNSAVTSDFAIGPATSHTFTKIVLSRQYKQAFAIKSSGQLWYWAIDDTYMSSSYFTTDGTWRQYGTDTDWTDIAAGENCFGAVKGGDMMFIGYGHYRQRGDGSTSSVSNWTTTNNTLTWSKVAMGYRLTVGITTGGHAYATGYGYDYMSGQGSTSTISTFTREQNSLTNIVQAVVGRRCSVYLNSSGDVYYTGNNGQNTAGPEITSTSDVNGPTLQSSSADRVISKLGEPSYYGTCHIDSDGYLRHVGYGAHRMRPDDDTTHSQGADGMRKLTSAGNGWTYFSAQNWGQTGSQDQTAVGIQNGALKFGGKGSSVFKAALGLTVDDTWETIKSSGVTSVALNGEGNNALHSQIIWS